MRPKCKGRTTFAHGVVFAAGWLCNNARQIKKARKLLEVAEITEAEMKTCDDFILEQLREANLTKISTNI